MLRKYMVRAGLHAQDGKVYRKGDIIATELDLITMFTDKFDRVLDETPASKGEPEKSFELNIKQNPEITPIPQKIVEVPNIPIPVQVNPIIPEQKSKIKTSKPVGKDVTNLFEIAVKEDFKVFKNGSEYKIYEPDDLDEPIHPNPVGKKEVSKTIKKYLKN